MELCPVQVTSPFVGDRRPVAKQGQQVTEACMVIWADETSKKIDTVQISDACKAAGSSDLVHVQCALFKAADMLALTTSGVDAPYGHRGRSSFVPWFLHQGGMLFAALHVNSCCSYVHGGCHA